MPEDRTDLTTPDKATWTNTQQVIAYSLVGAFIIVIFGWMFLPPKNLDQAALSIVNMLIGALVAKMTTVVDFFLGSSAESKSKGDAQTRTIDRLTSNLSGTGDGTAAAATAAAKEAAPAAAEAAAPAAAKKAAPPAAEAAAPPVVEAVVPPAVKAAVAEAFAEHNAEEQKTDTESKP